MIEMDVLRNGKKIGYNKYLFKKQNNLLIVNNKINFAAKEICEEVPQIKQIGEHHNVLCHFAGEIGYERTI